MAIDSTSWEAWQWLQQVQVQVQAWPKVDQESLYWGLLWSAAQAAFQLRSALVRGELWTR